MAHAPQHPRPHSTAPAREELVVVLGAPGSDALSAAGGKGASLARLIAAGLPVPAGFCLTTQAYALATAAALDAVLAELSGVPAGDDRLAALAARARELVLAAPVPDAVAAAVAQAYAAMGEGADVAVAVRSSATAEDLPPASFAGQQDTFLNVVGTAQVLDAVRRCWTSLWTDRAVAYRTTNAVDHRSVRLAVVVQEMVDADVAGVMFTANPLTGARHQVVIDAAPGLGEAVVSGRSTRTTSWSTRTHPPSSSDGWATSGCGSVRYQGAGRPRTTGRRTAIGPASPTPRSSSLHASASGWRPSTERHRTRNGRSTLRPASGSSRRGP